MCKVLRSFSSSRHLPDSVDYNYLSDWSHHWKLFFIIKSVYDMFCSRPAGGQLAVLASVCVCGGVLWEYFSQAWLLYLQNLVTWLIFTLNSTRLLLQDRCYRSWCRSVFPGSALRETSSLFSRWRSTTSSSLSPWRNRQKGNTDISPAVKRCIQAAGVWIKERGEEGQKWHFDTLDGLLIL